MHKPGVSSALKNKRVFPLVVTSLFAVIGALAFLTIYNAHQHKIRSTINATSTSLKSSVSFAVNGDVQKDGKYQGRDTLTFTFTLINKSTQSLNLLTLDTGVPVKDVYFAHNIHGTTGIDTNGKTIQFKNVVLEAGRELSLSFDGSLLVSDKDYKLSVMPKLVKGKDTLVGGSAQSYVVQKSQVFNNLNNQNVGGAI